MASDTLPPGNVIGRLSSPPGPPEMISLDDLGTELARRRGRIYQIGFSFPSGAALGNSQVVGHHKFSIGVTFPPDFTSYAGHASQASGTVNATASTAFKVQKRSGSPDTWSDVGTVTIASSGVVATFATSSNIAQRFAQGDVLRIVGPASADATFANPFFTLVGYES
jgi:hypothetical protein